MQKIILAGLLLLALSLPVQAAGHKGKHAGKHATTTQTFSIGTSAKISVAGNKSATLADIKVGDHVRIAYTEANGVLTAIHIKDAGPNPVKHAKKAKSAKKHHKSGKHKGTHLHKSTSLHAHGIVQSVDTSAMTLTIKEKHHH